MEKRDRAEQDFSRQLGTQQNEAKTHNGLAQDEAIGTPRIKDVFARDV